jgi:(E)-4-hydroxy-3-methylbut-2-enyl-diphosphate synthase
MKIKTNQVKVGSVVIGGGTAVKIQSMTTSKTEDVDATLKEILELYEAGCEIIRVTVQGLRQVESVKEIRKRIQERGLNIPLVADIHFFPKAALSVAPFVDKVRVNPGNFAIDSFKELIDVCKRHQTAIRVGVNHGSLAEDILYSYGDTPLGMCESAFRFLRIAKQESFDQIIVSLKSSNPLVMMRAYRLFVEMQKKEEIYCPLHLGVTEAGEGIEGRIKAAFGIGPLLLDGIGDTIRVSLTEDAIQEIGPCKILKNIPPYPGKLEYNGESKDEAVIHLAGWAGTFLLENPTEKIELKTPFGEAFDLDLKDKILQAARIKMTKADFISCPSCGRTQFNLQSVTRKIKKATEHLVGVKIAIMGCIVNGPGEMADADFGYVGSKPGFVDLYKKNQKVISQIHESEALEALIGLLKSESVWFEPLLA